MNDGVLLDNFAHFGDGNTCMVYAYKKYREEDGVIYWEFQLRPGKKIVNMYNLGNEIDPLNGAIRRTYPETDVILTDMSLNHFRVWITTTFEGHATPASMSDDEKDVQILNLQKKVNLMEIENAELHQMLRTRSMPESYIKQASSLVREARSAASKITTGGAGEMDGDADDEY